MAEISHKMTIFLKVLIQYKIIILLTIAQVLCTEVQALAQAAENPVNGWAVLAEKDDYTGLGMHDLQVNHIDITRMRTTLEEAGWDSGHILDLPEFDRETLQEKLNWLKAHADENDIVIFYVSAHESYLRDKLSWQDFFAKEWAQISSNKRLLIVDTCKAADFTDMVADDPSPHMSVAAVNNDENAWRGLETEGLPIIGCVFTYYFTESLKNLAADRNDDGRISVQEALQMAGKQQRAYMHDVVWAVPKFAEMAHETGFFPEKDPTCPHLVVDDMIGGPLYIQLNAYGYQSFTDKEGRTIRAKVLKVDVQAKKVTLERDNKKKATVPISILSEADQKYIYSWYPASNAAENNASKVK